MHNENRLLMWDKINSDYKTHVLIIFEHGFVVNRYEYVVIFLLLIHSISFHVVPFPKYLQLYNKRAKYLFSLHHLKSNFSGEERMQNFTTLIFIYF